MTHAPSELDLIVMDAPGEEEGMRQGWAVINQRGGMSRLSLQRKFQLRKNPPPDTLFMRAMEMDLVVFSMDYDGASLQIITHKDIVSCELYADLTERLVKETAKTAATLVSYARDRGVPCDDTQVRDALTHGTWPKTEDAMLQAAAFIHHLRDALWIASSTGRHVIWSYSNAAWLSYDYP